MRGIRSRASRRIGRRTSRMQAASVLDRRHVATWQGAGRAHASIVSFHKRRIALAHASAAAAARSPTLTL